MTVSSRVGPVVSVLCVYLYATPAAAGLISWTSFDGVVSTSASNTVPYAGGSVTVSTNPLISVAAGALPSFATTSDRYANIDTIPFSILVLTPEASQTGSPYQIEFDFTGTTLNSGGAVNVGGLFYEPTRGAFTEFTVQAFEADDTTPFALTDLAFEQHAFVGSGGAAGADAPLSWDPSTGVLTVASGPTEQVNSRFGFFSPMSGGIGRIVFTASTLSITTNGDQVYFGLGAQTAAGGQPLAGDKLLLKEHPSKTKQRGINLVAHDYVDLGGGAESADDPTVYGGTLRVHTAAGEGFDHTYDLAAAGWRDLARKGQHRGYKYRGEPFRSIVVKGGQLVKLVGKGDAVEHTLASDPRPVDVELTLGGRRYCWRFGGTIQFRETKKFLSRQAPAPTTCP